MKTTIVTALTVLVIAVSFDLALAGGNHWSALDRKWKRITTWQEKEEMRFKTLDAEAARLLKKIEGARQLVRPAR